MPPASSSTAGTPPLLCFEQVSKTYPDGCRQIPVLEQVSFEVHRGEQNGMIDPEQVCYRCGDRHTRTIGNLFFPG